MASSCSRFTGKVALVTASTEGIGYAIARRLGQEGAKVMISSRKQANVDRALKSLKEEKIDVEGMVCHVGKKSDRLSLLKKFQGKVRIMGLVSKTNTPESSVDKMFDINVKSSFMLCQEVVPELEKRGSGSIIIVSSLAAFLTFILIDAYSVTKTALIGMFKALAPELASDNIRVNCIAPGLIDTKFSKALTSKDFTLHGIPMRGLGVPEDCPGAVAFLASDDAKFINGETIVISGGQTSRL